MRIGIDCRIIGRRRTGDETVFRELVRALAALPADGDEYHLMIDTRDAAAIAATVDALGIAAAPHMRLVPLGSGNRFVWNVLTAPRYCRRAGIDVYHTQYITPLLMPAATAVVTHIHDVSFAAMPEQIGWRDLLFLWLLIPRSLRRAAAVIAVSGFTRDEIVRYYGVPAAKVHVVPNAVGAVFSAGRPDLAAVDTARRAYGLPERYIFSLGTMQPRKNIPFLVAAFARVADRLPGTHLVLSGGRGHHFDAAIDAAVAAYPAVADRIVFTGYIDEADLPAVYAGARCFAFPSLYEGFGVPLLEAMAAGTSVVASDIPPLREVAQDGALYASPHDLDAFADALYTVNTDDKTRERLAHAACARVAAFSWHRSAILLRTVYQSAVRNH